MRGKKNRKIEGAERKRKGEIVVLEKIGKEREKGVELSAEKCSLDTRILLGAAHTRVSLIKRDVLQSALISIHSLSTEPS